MEKILDKAENSKWKEIKYNWMEEILNVKEKMLQRWKKAYRELGLTILMKRGRIQPIYVLSSTKERKRIRKFNKCYVKMYLLSKRHKFILPLPYGFKYKRKRNLDNLVHIVKKINY